MSLLVIPSTRWIVARGFHVTATPRTNGSLPFLRRRCWFSSTSDSHSNSDSNSNSNNEQSTPASYIITTTSSSPSGIVVERYSTSSSSLLLSSSSSRSIPTERAQSVSNTFDNTNGNAPNTAKKTDEIRLSKWIAQHRSVSRREAERWIREGNVRVRNVMVSSSAATVAPLDIPGVTVRGKRLVDSSTSDSNNNSNSSNNNTLNTRPERTRVWLVHKMAGELVTENDPHGRPSLMERLVLGGIGKSKKHKHRRAEHLKPIGRLDMPTTGLILVTNDGEYSRQLERSALHRVYLVRVHGRVAEYKLNAMRKSLVLQNIRYDPMKVELTKTRKSLEATNQWLTVTCTEGKNRQVRKILQHFGCKCVCTERDTCELSCFSLILLSCHLIFVSNLVGWILFE